ncbi:MAG: hypothetical protein M3Y19_07755 [Actinomycetota bacterium]|nr:hypothetical protein [Actinomycetota bacterium]
MSAYAFALRAALAQRERAPHPAPYRVRPFRGAGLLPVIDLDDNAALLDVMDANSRP